MKTLAAEIESEADRTAADERDFIGTILTYCGDPSRALSHLDRAAELRPNDANIRFNQAAAQRMMGEFEASELNLDRAIRADPHLARAYLLRSDLRRQTATRNHVAELEQALARGCGGALGKTLLRFALGKELDDLAEYDRAFVQWKMGNDHHRSMIGYDIKSDLKLFDALFDLYERPLRLPAKPGATTDGPIFIVGLPRSGTTLTDRIISGHPDVTSAGELRAFENAVRDWQGGQQDCLAAHRAIARNEPAGLAELADSYQREALVCGGGSGRIVDKMPINYLYIPAILRSIPTASVVMVRRNAIDSCFAMYRCHLSSPYDFTNDLDDLAAYYSRWSRLMARWTDQLADRLMPISYEDLVGNSEASARQLFDFCGLEWDIGFLDANDDSRSFATVSAVQARQPIYTTSVGKWSNYTRWLEPWIAVSGLTDAA